MSLKIENFDVKLRADSAEVITLHSHNQIGSLTNFKWAIH